MNTTEITPQELEEIRKIVRKFLTKEAIERLGRIKLVKPQLALEIELNLFKLIQAGKIKSFITDEQIKQILKALSR